MSSTTLFDAYAVQMCSGPDIEQNLLQLKSLLSTITPSTAPKLVVLPENFAAMGLATPQPIFERLSQIKQQLSEFAVLHHAWIVGGSLPEAVANNIETPPKYYATSFVFNPQGEQVASYYKMHLFDATVSDNVGQYKESDTYAAGKQPVVISTPFGNLGLIICYDLRFPELAIKLRQLGADILVCPAAFTVPTGQKHWSTLISARALDTQCWLMAADQCGERLGRATWGHSAIVNYDGHILNMADQNTPQLVHHPIDLAKQELMRTALPIYQHRKTGLLS